ncbi:hypothetical protein [Azospirillum argentinense]|uniref:hypothetical protein n=1 Tax=Azospirillum argentinense TaxID=2970906 RepID=UPI0032DE6C28
MGAQIINFRRPVHDDIVEARDIIQDRIDGLDEGLAARIDWRRGVVEVLDYRIWLDASIPAVMLGVHHSDPGSHWREPLDRTEPLYALSSARAAATQLVHLLRRRFRDERAIGTGRTRGLLPISRSPYTCGRGQAGA